MARIKICGMRTLDDVGIVNELKPDYIGFILSDGYKRTVTIDMAKKLKEHLDASIKAVGVFVNEDVKNVQIFVDSGIIDIVQLHGDEQVEYISQIKNAPVIKVLKPNSFDKVKYYEPYVDYFLFDSGAGTGLTFDWSSMPKTSRPFFLAGGLGEENLKQAIKTVEPFAVDMSSSVETDNKKDYKKIKEVIKITRSIQ